MANMSGGRFAAPKGPPSLDKTKKQVTVAVAPYITSESRAEARRALKERYEERERLAEEEKRMREEAEKVRNC